jgi:hypothetical protein
MMLAKHDDDGFSVFTIGALAEGEGARGRQVPRRKVSRRRHGASDAYFSRKRDLTVQEIVQHDDGILVVVKLESGIIVLRSNPNPEHQKIRKLLDRIGFVGIGSDGAIDTIHNVLGMQIDSILRLGYTRGDVWGNELGKFLSRVLGEFFFSRSRDDEDPAIFPAYTFLFEVGHPLYGSFVELITFDGQTESRLPPITIVSPGKADEHSKKIGEALTRTVESFSANDTVELTQAITAFVGNAAKVIRKFRASPAFECVFLDAFAAARRDFRRVWNYIDVEAAIASVTAPPQP